MGNEGHFPLVSILNTNVVVPPSNIKFGKDFGIFNLINEVLDEGERVCIFDSMTVDISIILARLEGIRGIFLVDKEEGCCLGGI